MKKVVWIHFLLAATLFAAGPARAHFGMVIPSDQMVMQGEETRIKLDLLFWHPFEGIGMDLVKPARFQVFVNGRAEDLSADLKETKLKGHRTWSTRYNITRPGIYVFYMEPKPYWEPGEDCFIVHHTKTVVTAFGDDEGWDRELGLKTEIVPMSKPFGLYAGNIFQGIVKLDGKPVPHAEVEVEFYNKGGKFHAPTDYMVTQVVKADAGGIFVYAVPRPGWWGFAALNTSDKKMKHNGEDKDVELGAVIWVKFHEMK